MTDLVALSTTTPPPSNAYLHGHSSLGTWTKFLSSDFLTKDGSGNSTLSGSTNGAVIQKVANASTGSLSAARFDLSTGTANSYAIWGMFDAAGSPYAQISFGSAVLGFYLDAPTHYFRDAAGTQRMVIASGVIRPGSDNAITNGNGSFRWSVVYAATGTINTSDAREKDWLGALADHPDLAAYMAAARDIGALPGFYQWKAEVAAKGAEHARIHMGWRAQDVAAIFMAHGLEEDQDIDLDPDSYCAPGTGPSFRHGFLCFDSWEAVAPTEAAEEVRDDDGNIVIPARPADPGRAAGNRFGLRHDEFFAFILAAQELRLAALEAALA